MTSSISSGCWSGWRLMLRGIDLAWILCISSFLINMKFRIIFIIIRNFRKAFSWWLLIETSPKQRKTWKDPSRAAKERDFENYHRYHWKGSFICIMLLLFLSQINCGQILLPEDILRGSLSCWKYFSISQHLLFSMRFFWISPHSGMRSWQWVGKSKFLCYWQLTLPKWNTWIVDDW